MKLFAFLLRSSQAIVLTAVLIGAIGGAATIGQLALIRSALHVDPATGAISRSQLALAFAAMCVLVLATRLVSDRLLAKLSQRSVSRILRHLCGRIVESPLRRIEEVGQARLLVTLTEDISMITMALNGVPVVAVNLITLVLGLAYLGWISPPLFLPLTGVLVFGVGSYMAASRGARHFLKQGREQSDVLMRHVRTVVNGVKELKLHDARREAFFSDVLFPADEEVRRLQLKGFSIQAAAINWGRLLFLITIGLVLFAWPLFVAIDPASQAAVVLTVLFLMAPVERVMAYLPLFSRANIGLRKVQELGLSLEGDEPTQGEPITSWNRLELDDVSFAYVDQATDREFRLGPLSLELTPGEIVFVVGGNGGGKTTLIKLLSGLYAADSGELRLDGRPLAPADL
ncbi:MAG TPA: ATP-binding cassette domain-containing protein, partial [Pirellulales bacterium]